MCPTQLTGTVHAIIIIVHVSYFNVDHNTRVHAIAIILVIECSLHQSS